MKTASMKSQDNGFAVAITDATDLGLAMLIGRRESGFAWGIRIRLRLAAVSHGSCLRTTART
jgi:hypothetical protein